MNDQATIDRLELQQLRKENEQLRKERDAAINVAATHASIYSIGQLAYQHKHHSDEWVVSRNLWGVLTVGDIRLFTDIYDRLQAKQTPTT